MLLTLQEEETMLKTAIQKVVDGMDLSEEEMEGAMDVIMSGQATPVHHRTQVKR
jgi:anthranilate phosphoribosyltransferase